MVEAEPTLVKVTAVPGSTSKGEVFAVPIVTLFRVDAIETTGTVVIAAPTDIESPTATLVILFKTNAVVPIPAVCPTAIPVLSTSTCSRLSVTNKS